MPDSALIARIADQKSQLDRLRPVTGDALRAVQKAYDVELTYTSNAIEGNTLTLRETAELIEHGITVGGKPLRDHLEAADHYDALLWMRDQAATEAPLSLATVRELHRRIVARSQPEIGGFYSPHPRRIAGSRVVFPSPAKVPDLMDEFGAWLAQAPLTAEASFDAHFRLVTIHPFSDGNGRTARLLMNLVLLRGGYPPIAVRPEDRGAYLDAIEHAQLGGSLDVFQTLMHTRLEATMDDYLAVLREALPTMPDGSTPSPPGH